MVRGCEVCMPRPTRSRPSASSRSAAAALPPPATLYTGRLVGLAADGRVLVRLDGGEVDHQATCAGPLDATVISQAVGERTPVVLRGDPDGLVVLGLLQPLASAARREVGAGEQLVLRSGDASLTLTAAGKVLLRGAYVSSWSNGVNRIVGRTVRLD
jgi:hypothetical protein